MAFPVKSEGSIKSVFSASSITSGVSSTSSSFDLSQYSNFGVWYQASPSSSVSAVRLYYEMSYDDTSSNFVIPESASDIDTSISDGNAHVALFSPKPMRFIRFRATCGSTDGTDVTFTVKLFAQ